MGFVSCFRVTFSNAIKNFFKFTSLKIFLFLEILIITSSSFGVFGEALQCGGVNTGQGWAGCPFIQGLHSKHIISKF